MKTLLWLDDIRDPKCMTWLMQYAPQFAYGEGQVIWVKNYNEFCDWITENGLPDQISFDHDLSDFQSMKFGYPDLMDEVDMPKEEKTGMDCAKFLVDYCLDHNLTLPLYGVHSANPTGADNIRSLLKNFQQFSKKV